MGDLGRGDIGGAFVNYTGLGQVLGNNGIGQLGDFLGTNANAVNTSGFAPSAGETSLAQSLMNQYQGTGGPSAAEMQMRAGLGQANAGANAFAASQRGVSPALAAQMGQMAQAQNSQNTVQGSGVLRAQEAMGAAGTLGNLYSSQRQSAGQANALTMQANENASKRRSDLISGAGQAAAMMMSDGGQVPQQSGTQFHPDMIAFAHKLGEMASQNALNMKSGGPVPGQANVPGDSPVNDTVHAKLSPGEVVIPRTVVAMGPEAIANFAAALSKRGAA